MGGVVPGDLSAMSRIVSRDLGPVSRVVPNRL